MGPINAHREEELLVAERAADWLRRLETADAAENAAFMAWLKESPRHVREILLLTTWDKVLQGGDPQRRIDVEALHATGAANVVALQANRFRRQPLALPYWVNNLTTRPFSAAITAGVALLATVALAIWWLVSARAQTYSTAVGEQHSIALADGSIAQLNTLSKLRVQYSPNARDFYLLKGQVLFKAAHNTARPFRVHIGGALIQALGTEFDVYRQVDRTTVSVVEGSVRVSGNEVRVLAAGETANVIPNGQITRGKPVDVIDATAWRQRRLVFRKSTLGDMATEFNRYNLKPQLRVEGTGLQARQFNGVFDAGDPSSLLQFLSQDPGVATRRDGDNITIFARPALPVRVSN